MIDMTKASINVQHMFCLKSNDSCVVELFFVELCSVLGLLVGCVATTESELKASVVTVSVVTKVAPGVLVDIRISVVGATSEVAICSLCTSKIKYQ